jgi:hypothetical protein
MKSVPFLKEIASLLFQEGACDFSRHSIVFPNKRARLYFSQYIGEMIRKPVLAPRYFTISELMEEASGYVYADKVSLMVELYTTYREVFGNTTDFDAFYPYSETLLADFDEIDKYLVNAHHLFTNLSDLKHLDGRFNYLAPEQIDLIRSFWGTFQPEKFSESQHSFISLWEMLPKLYTEFKERLRKKNIAYEGMAYRHVCDLLEEDSQINIFENTRYIFIGFNALNVCEERLFGHMQTRGLASFFWDYDSWYTNNDIHEAGYFMRKNLKNFPPLQKLHHENLIGKDKQIVFVPVASNAGQAGVLSTIFSSLEQKGSHSFANTAIVLADENLLVPVLYAVPSFVTELNVSMGYPLSGSAAFHLVRSLHDLTRNARTTLTGYRAWHFRDIMAVFNNPLLGAECRQYAEELRKKCLQNHLEYLSQSDLLSGEFTHLIFREEGSSLDTASYLQSVFQGVADQLSHTGDDNDFVDNLQINAFQMVHASLSRLCEIVTAENVIAGSEIFFRLFIRVLQSSRLPFTGEPLAGLQVMGLLETRTLDFDNVILLSANEGILPRAPNHPTFIPLSMRGGFGLPGPEYHDAIYAYYFYRLIQRAEKIFLVYDSSTGGMQTGERSRFLHQIAYEMPISFEEWNLSPAISRFSVKPVILEKTPTDLSRFIVEDDKYISASALNDYLTCRLKFCFKHVKNLKTSENITEDIDARMMGTILHNALRQIYSSFGKSAVSREKLDDLLNQPQKIDLVVDRAIAEELFGTATVSGNRDLSGYNQIIRQVMRTYLIQLMKAERFSVPFSVFDLEGRYVVPISIPQTTANLVVKLGGIIDRIDQRNGQMVILDYKAGAVKNKFDSVASLFRSEKQPRNEAVFQVFLYSYVFSRLFPEHDVVPGLLFLRGSYAEEFSYEIRQTGRKEFISRFADVHEEFEMLLRACLEELFNQEQPYTQTSDHRVCEHCNYAAICGR